MCEWGGRRRLPSGRRARPTVIVLPALRTPGRVLRGELTDYSGESPMRKPRPAATRTIVLSALTFALVASSCESKDSERNVASQAGPGLADVASGASGAAGT